MSPNLERDLGSERVAVVYDRLPIIAIPAVQLHTPAALQQHLGGEGFAGRARRLINIFGQLTAVLS